MDITPNEHGDWLNQRRDDFATFRSISPKGEAESIFETSSPGFSTSRDARVLSFSKPTARQNATRMIEAYETARKAGVSAADSTSAINWSADLRRRFEKGRPLSRESLAMRSVTYRPFCRQWLAHGEGIIERPGSMLDQFSASRANLAFTLLAPIDRTPFSTLMVQGPANLNLLMDAVHLFARWRYVPVNPEDRMLIPDHGQDNAVDGYRRVDNITDESLARFQDAYGDSFTKDDIFFYTYGLLHSPTYRETYSADLKKSLARVPLVADAAPLVEAGRTLSDWHLAYETVEPYPIDGLEADPGATDPYAFFRVEKLKFAKVRDPATNKLVADRSTIIYNERITLSGIPEQAYRYMLGSRSAIEWIIDRYRVKPDNKDPELTNDPNNWSREVEDPRYIIDLLARIVTVSPETMAIVDSLPALDIRKNRG
ncbi:type ISP restriction/modification enzyme [Janibacter limosus]|uniref:Uncharacterized protein n=1 Tax=Janibacter limosus TaxID=53458 RepID=A0AC61U7D0_9MICO|nr:type ISP restriction/modification enzyme [Janibacter limosus]UUZ45946.1 type ISP restriction/modification enzyme [Janibacter limosus]